jgi:uncharacterized membrane protein
MNPAEVTFAPEAHSLIIYALHWIGTAIELLGVGVIVAGAVVATVLLARRGAREGWDAAIQQYRANLGRGVLLGLEFLVAADIIGTVAATPTFYSLAILGLIIGIRTLLSFSLEVEIEGRWPWHRHSGGKSP